MQSVVAIAILALIAGCAAEREYRCVVTPATLVECNPS